MDDSNCLQVKANDATICGVCATATALKDGKCTKLTVKIDNCISYTDPDTCSKCKPGYSYNTGSKKCNIITDNCIDDDGTKCIQCAPSYLLKSDNTCVIQPVFTSININSVYDIWNYKMYKYCPLCKEGYTLNQKSFAQDNSNEMCIKDPPSHVSDSNCI